MSEMCHCGQPLHYSHPWAKAYVDRMVLRLGEHINVTVDGRTWKVQRHYIALHGLKGKDVSTLGFEEVT